WEERGSKIVRCLLLHAPDLYLAAFPPHQGGSLPYVEVWTEVEEDKGDILVQADARDLVRVRFDRLVQKAVEMLRNFIGHVRHCRAPVRPGLVSLASLGPNR